MSILQRVFRDPILEKINTQRLPNGPAVNLQGGIAHPSSQTAQLGALTSVSWLFSVVNRIAQSMSAVEWRLYRVQNGDREEIDDHPAIDLWKSANPFVTRQDFIETSQQHMELVGEMWWVLVRNASGIPVELQVIRPDRMSPIPHPTEFISGYKYRIGSETIHLEKDDVIYTRQPNPLDSYRGIGVVQSMMVDIGAERMAAEWMHNFFRNSAEPGGIIEFPNGIQDADFERLVNRWRYQHQGVANSSRVAILERGHWVSNKLTQRDMQFKELREFERNQILGAFGMPLPIMGITESVNRANAEAAELMYTRWVIRPRLIRLRSALNEKLLKIYPDGETLEFDFIDPVPEDKTALISEATLGYEKKILTLNEARRRFGEDDWEGPEGDELASSPAPMLAPPEDTVDPEIDLELEEEESEEEAGYKPPRRRRDVKVEANEEYPPEANKRANRLERGWKKRFATELRAITAFIESHDKAFTQKLTIGEVGDYDWNWWAKYGDEVIDELAESFALVIAAEAPTMSPPEVQRLASSYAEHRGAALLRVDGPLNLARMTRNRVNTLVANTIQSGESINTLTRNLKKDLAFSTDRARMVARTETASALGQGQKEAARSQGRTEKRWVTQGDNRVNEEICATNGDQDWIPITAEFQSGHDTIPGHINCRCVVQYRNTPITNEDRGFIPEVRCPACNRKNGENVAQGTPVRCRRCKHTWEV